MTFAPDIQDLARKIIALYARRQRKIVTAESCTGGLIAAALTDVAGSSAVFERGFVSYSLDSKTDLLGVLPERLANFGPVSVQIAEDMAAGALEYSHADVALSVTGLAGPSGGSAQKPVGLVYFGLATREGAHFHVQGQFQGSREQIREQCVREALTLLLSLGEDRD